MISERPKEYYSVTINRLLRNRECAKVTFAMRTMFGLNWVDPHYTVVTVDKEQHMVTFFNPWKYDPSLTKSIPKTMQQVLKNLPFRSRFDLTFEFGSQTTQEDCRARCQRYLLWKCGGGRRVRLSHRVVTKLNKYMKV